MVYFSIEMWCSFQLIFTTKNGKWKNTRQEGKYLFPVKALSKVFRGKFTDGLIALDKKGYISMEQKFDPKKKYLHPFYKKNWVVFAKLPMHNPQQVVNYIGRYSHRIALSNHRIKAVADSRVFFSWFDYRTSKTGVMDLSAEDFLGRYSLHVLPAGFMKIRHYGILSSRNKTEALAFIRKFLGAEKPKTIRGIPWDGLFEIIYRRKAFACPVCKTGKMVVVQSKPPKNRGSPQKMLYPNYNFQMQS